MTTRSLVLVVVANSMLNLGLIRLICHKRRYRGRESWRTLCRNSRQLREQARQLATDLAHGPEVTS